MERRWRKTHLAVHQEEFKAAHKRVTELCTVAKMDYFREKIEACAGDQKALFNLSNCLLFKKKNNSLPTCSDAKKLANDFSKFFDTKIENIRKELLQKRTYDPNSNIIQTSSLHTICSFEPVTENELKKIIMSSNSKCCSLDPIPTSLLKSCLDVLLPVLCKIINSSISSCSVPASFKQAIVTPLLKKSSLDRENMKNYRPVSNLPYVSKLLEKVVMKQLNDHMEHHDLCEPLQSAYRSHHSTETAMVKVMNDLLLAMDTKKQCVLLVLLDLSAAFDTIDHSVLLQRLQNMFGVDGDALQWFRAYFNSRSQAVTISEQSSAAVPLTTGVPQGSVAGPALFPRYTQPIGDIVQSHGMDFHLYADDTQLYVGCPISEAVSKKEHLEQCVSELRDWMSANLLKLNDDKTEFMVIGTRHTLQHCPDELLSIKVGNICVNSASSARNIGVVMDPLLSMEKQVAKITRTCYMALRDIGRIRRFLTVEATKQLVLSHVMCHLDVNNALLYNIPKSVLNKLQIVQNRSARLIFKLDKYAPTEEIRCDVLHWLPVEFRIQFKINLLTYKCLNNLAPSYLCNLISIRVPTKQTRSAAKFLLNEKTGRISVGDRAFSVCAPKLWNALPENLKYSANINIFKNNLKTHLFKIAFDICN